MEGTEEEEGVFVWLSTAVCFTGSKSSEHPRTTLWAVVLGVLASTQTTLLRDERCISFCACATKSLRIRSVGVCMWVMVVRSCCSTDSKSTQNESNNAVSAAPATSACSSAVSGCCWCRNLAFANIQSSATAPVVNDSSVVFLPTSSRKL